MTIKINSTGEVVTPTGTTAKYYYIRDRKILKSECSIVVCPLDESDLSKKDIDLIIGGLKTKQALRLSNAYGKRAKQESENCSCNDLEKTFAEVKEINQLIKKLNDNYKRSYPQE